MGTYWRPTDRNTAGNTRAVIWVVIAFKSELVVGQEKMFTLH